MADEPGLLARLDKQGMLLEPRIAILPSSRGRESSKISIDVRLVAKG